MINSNYILNFKNILYNIKIYVYIFIFHNKKIRSYCYYFINIVKNPLLNLV